MPPTYVQPEVDKQAFTCPNCDTFSVQSFNNVVFHGNPVTHVHLGFCLNCQDVTYWRRTDADGWSLAHPQAMPAPEPNVDLPPDILQDYNEAALIVTQSPRGAAALLRLAIQKLCSHLKYDQKDIDKAIGAMVKNGLRPSVQKAMDVVRITGNEAVHPGTLDVGDNTNGLALRMFGLVNMVAQQMITNPRESDELFAEMPQPKQDGVAQRDGTVTT